MKVLHLITSLDRGGIERWLVSMLEQIPRTECTMDVCCKGDTEGPYAPLARELGACVYLRPLRVTQVGFVNRLARLVMSERYDIVHNHLHVYSGLPVFACRNLGTRIITSFHNTDLRSHTWLRRPGVRHLRDVYMNVSVRYALRYSAMLTGCSQDVVNSIRRSYGGNGHPWRVIYYGTDLVPIASENERRDFRQLFSWPEDAPIIVHVGRFAEQKNHFGLIEILNLVLQRVPDAKLLLIGGGPLREAVEAVVHERRLSTAVAFLGYRDDVPAILSCSNVFLFPSWFEGLPVAALEASAAGVPVVASKVPGINEAIEEGVTGYLFDPKDHEGMANAVVSLLSDPGLAGRVGAAGRNRIVKGFSRQMSANSLLGLYHECISQH